MAEDRKARLKALAARAGRTKEPAPEEDAGETNTTSSRKPNLSFRNYAPTDTSLTVDKSAGPQEDDEPSAYKRPRRTTQEESESDAAGTTTKAPLSSSDVLKNALQEAQKDPIISSTTVVSATITSMAPKKSNWDLKRDIGDKLAKLEKRTQKALVDLLKERLELEAAKAMDEEGGDDSDLD